MKVNHAPVPGEIDFPARITYLRQASPDELRFRVHIAGKGWRWDGALYRSTRNDCVYLRIGCTTMLLRRWLSPRPRGLFDLGSHSSTDHDEYDTISKSAAAVTWNTDVSERSMEYAFCCGLTQLALYAWALWPAQIRNTDEATYDPLLRRDAT